MDLTQLRTFVAVAREGSITRASEVVHLSQPAVSAHVKAIEDALGLVLFDRKARGMSLTADGRRLLLKAEGILAAHRELLDEATRARGLFRGAFRIGASQSSDHAAIGRLVATLAERAPEVEVVLRHGTSADILAALRSEALDAAFYNEAGVPDAALETLEVSRFAIHAAAAPGLASASDPSRALASLPWIFPPASACCGRAAEAIFAARRFRPKRVVSVDREDVTAALVAGGLGVGLLHAERALAARARGEVELFFEAPTPVRALFAHLGARREDPLLQLARSILASPSPSGLTTRPAGSTPSREPRGTGRPRTRGGSPRS